jgi:prefoldin subunit 5
MTLKNQILVALGLNKAKSLRLEWQAKTDDGTILVSTADELTSGVDISVLTEDGTTIPLPAGSYTTDTGVSFRVEEEGIVAEVLQSEGEAVSEEMAEIGDWEGLEKRIQNLEDAVSDLKESKDGGDTEMAEDGEVVEEAVEEAVEEVVEEVVAVAEDAVTEIAAAIDDATPAEVTPELAEQAAAIAVEVLQEKAEEVAAEVTTLRKTRKSKTSTKSTLRKAKRAASKKASLSKLARENKKLKSEAGKRPATTPLASNKFSSARPTPSKQDFKRMSKQEKFLYELYK